MQDQCAPPKNLYEIEREVDQLKGNIEQMVGMSETLRDKLSVVLRSDPLEPSADKLSTNTCTPLGAKLRTLANQVNNITDIQADILNRLEL